MEGSEEEYTGWERTRGAESSEEEEEEEEEESEGSAPGVETVRVEKVTFDHKLNIYLASYLASCFCSACRACDYDKCFVRAEHPALVPKSTAAVVEEVVVMDTGVDPSGVDPAVGGRMRKAKEIKFAKRKNVCLM